MQPGSIVLVALPQADGQMKNRPAVLLCEMPSFRDLLLCGISSQLQQAVADFDDLLLPANADFSGSGLRVGSVIRLGFLTVLPKAKIIGTLGIISGSRHQQLLSRLAAYLQTRS